ncbi:MAG: hypothetical protein WC169_05555 [Dehalococcoidia bacterium]
MELSWWRDLAIVVWAGIATIAVVFICIIIILLYRKLVPLMKSADSVMESADIVVNKVGNVVDYTRDEVISPVVQLGSAVQGIAQGINLVVNLFKKKEE